MVGCVAGGRCCVGASAHLIFRDGVLLFTQRTGIHAPDLPSPTVPQTVPRLSNPDAADRQGASNVALPRDEDREAFAAIAASCGNRSEAEDLLAEIVNAK